MTTNGYDPRKLGETIKHLIKTSEKYSSQEKLAEALNVDPRTVGRWVNGQLDSISTLVEICDCFGIDVRAILG